jgi:hypothetical protein
VVAKRLGYYTERHCVQVDLAGLDIVGRNKLLFLIKEEVSSMQAYCMKCRTKREMKDAKSITMKNGRPATQGTCPVCGTKMFRIGKA